MSEQAVKGCALCDPDEIRKNIGEIVAETAQGWLVKPHNSRVPGKLMLFPRLHISNYRDMPGDWQWDVRSLLDAGLGADELDYTIIIEHGKLAGQMGSHVCMVFIPRTDEPESGTSFMRSATEVLEDAIQAADETECGMVGPV